MNIALIIISSLILVIVIAILLVEISRQQIINAFIYGINKTLIDLQTLYQYDQFNVAFIKVSLDNLERVNSARLKKAVDSDNYEDAAFYRDLIRHIDELKRLELKDIENYGEGE